MRILPTTIVALATLLVASNALADEPTAPAAKANPAGISDEAKTHFAAGLALLQDPEGEKVEEAYREFRAAYDLSGSPKILGNMGFCAMRLERDGEAIEAYARYLREVPDIDADERAQIVRDLQTLTIGVARLGIQTDKPAVRLIDVRIPVRGQPVTNTYGPVDGKLEVGVRPGHHTITAKLADHEDAVWEFDAFAGSRDRFSFMMRPRVVAPVGGTEARSGNIGPWLVMGIGSAMLVGGTVTGIVALGKTHDIEARCPKDVCPKKGFDLESARSNAKTFVRVTDVLLIGGSVVTLGGVGWLFFGGDKGDKGDKAIPPPAARAGARAVPRAGCGPGGCRAELEVVF
jgi:hypothetical protein